MIFRFIRAIVGTVILILIGYYFGLRGVRFYVVVSESMSPTLEIGDRLIGVKPEKLKYRDILVLDDPVEKEGVIIKRLIGLEGDLIEVKNNGYVYRNREKINEPYIKEKPTYTLNPVQIKSGEVFVLGDNRNNSDDSSIWGSVPADTVRAKIVMRYWPLKKFKIF